MARAKVVLIHASMKALLNDPGVRAELTRRGEAVLAAAQASAPVVSGAYKNSLRLEMTTSAALGIKFRRGGTDRPAAVVLSDSNHAMSVEASTGNLARALSYAGGEMLVDREMVSYTSAKGKTSRITRKQAENYGRRKR